jgi:periplasmic protein TonB
MDASMHAQPRRKPFQWLGTGTMWTFSVVFAILLNLALFSLMPRLAQTRPGEKEEYEKLNAVEFVRLKKKETPPEEKKKKEIPEKKLKNEPDPIKREMLRPRTNIDKMQIPYELNARLPAGAIQLPALDMETMVVDGPPTKDFYDIGELDAPLAALVRTPPIYPVAAKRRGVEGWVKVRFLVTSSGGVEKVTIVEARPEGTFEQAVERCVASWRFKPGTVDGEPVNAWAETVVRFELE